MKKKKEDEMNRMTVEDYVSDEEGQLQPTKIYKGKEVMQPEVRQPHRRSEELEAIRYQIHGGPYVLKKKGVKRIETN